MIGAVPGLSKTFLAAGHEGEGLSLVTSFQDSEIYIVYFQTISFLFPPFFNQSTYDLVFMHRLWQLLK